MTTKNRENSGWTIPWIHQADWEEMVHVTKQVREKIADESRVEIMQRIETIITLYKALEVPLNQLCIHTCPECAEVCCTKATVWYDQRDILVYHLATDSFPATQISKNDAGVCCHLGASGCNLPRLQRPFICTWYICSAQTAILKKTNNNPDTDIQEIIQRIKETRKKIESLCRQV